MIKMFALRSVPLVAGLAVFLALLPMTVAAEPDPMTLADTCAGCHGPDGYSPGPIPPLAGLSKSYLEASMKAFRDGRRPATVMNRIAKGYSDAEITAMAEYFSGMQPPSPTR